ncbi:MAG: TonB family protein [Synergistaceae bacterium]|jgi:protein TonB|nr:TonB family protein [Synergistaceae bacterium]
MRGALAVILSAAVHAMILCMLPGTEARTEHPSIRVSLRNVPAAVPVAAPAPPIPEAPPKMEPPPPKPQPEVKEVKKVEPVRTPPAPKQPAKPAETHKKLPSRAEPAATHAAPPATSSAETSAASDAPAAQSGEPLVTKSPGGGSIIDVSRLTVTKKITPEYPMISRKRRDQGTVTLLVTIKSGRVASVTVESSSGHAPLDESAARAARGWEFDSSGYGDTVTARIPFAFKLK